MNALEIRQRLGRKLWRPPAQFGPDGWYFTARDNLSTVIVTRATYGDGDDWVHASIAHPDRMPSYDELCLLHAAVFGDGYAYQVFPPPSEHVNIHNFALHLFGRDDGKPGLPEFAEHGSI